ncbi:MAG: hypothetical protein KJ556_15840 [Gammaproteobacteria bacterium]|nr:hypothetical protein [Gammaproteobacteria bacterium]MBU2058359.1 hypothetical protein [Gammaproteobacteria bacterium]MBU2176588.1 hypothetical protein [Gammaproteobacteria bacterium]MBU2248470.1 hypothetical protein [Gammaproteobacteria bacterium]MBU2345667.1 hypothetical protein [Gammaproteobacteria bacterium]
MKFLNAFVFSLFVAFSSGAKEDSAKERDLLVTTDFVLNAGESQSRIIDIQKPEHASHFVMLGFNPVKVLSVSCTLHLYGPSTVLLGRYNCAEQQVHYFKTPLPASAQYKAHIEVTNSNFTKARTAFSVINRFKFITSAP